MMEPLLAQLAKESAEREQEEREAKSPQPHLAKSREPSRYKPGRPSYWADLSENRDPAQPVYDKFYAAVKTLTPREARALAHTLGYQHVSIWRWMKTKTAPDYGIMAKVIAWVENGKPVIKRQRMRAAMF
jgi:hypothetical protein